MAERWLTYQQAGDALGMSAEAARQCARRLGWRTQPGNEGRTLVLVPDEPGVRPRRPPVQTAGQPPGQPAEAAELVELRERAARAEGEAAILREQLESERERADKAAARSDRAEAEASALRERAGWAEGKSLALREQAKAERERAEAARAELADWTAGGPLARAWRAFVNRRGRP